MKFFTGFKICLISALALGLASCASGGPTKEFSNYPAQVYSGNNDICLTEGWRDSCVGKVIITQGEYNVQMLTSEQVRQADAAQQRRWQQQQRLQQQRLQ